MKRLFLASAGLVLAAASAAAQTEGVAEFQSTITTDQGKAIAGTSRVFVSKIGYRVDAEMDLLPTIPVTHHFRVRSNARAPR